MRQAFFDPNLLARGLAFDYSKDEVLPHHDHPWAQLVYAQSGTMQVQTDEASWLVPPTRAIWIPAGVTHWIRMRGDVAMRTLYINQARRVWPIDCAAIEVSNLLKELILHAVTLEQLSANEIKHKRIVSLLEDLVLGSRAIPLVLPTPKDARAKLMAQQILDQPGTDLNLDQLCADIGASLRTLQRTFKRETGLTLADWRLRARMQLAIVLLNEQQPVTQVALLVGYRSSSAFTTAFSRVFGTSPSRYQTTRTDKYNR